jgi:PKD repeat protein
MSVENNNHLKQTKIRILVLISLLSVMISAKSQNVSLPELIQSCRTDSLIVDVGPEYDQYLWNTGDTASFIWVDNPGKYWVSLNIGDTLFYTDTTFINIFNVGIVQDDFNILCGDTVVLNVDSLQYNYVWEPGMEMTDSIVVYPRDTTTYLVAISDPDSMLNYCIDSVKVIVDPIIFTDTLIQLKMGCPDEKKAQVQITVSGGNPPYEYEWSDGDPVGIDPSKAISLSDGDRWVTVTDTIGCYMRHDFEVIAHPLPEGLIHFDPDSIIYIQKPIIAFEFENISFDSIGSDTFQINTWTWDFGDDVTTNEIAPTHIYAQEGEFTVSYNFITKFGCPGTDSTKITVKPVTLITPSLVTPNGDGKNELFIIKYDDGSNDSGEAKSGYGYYEDDEETFDPLNTYYLETELVIFNRWGDKVYEDLDYKNDWDAEGLVDGTYFYFIVCKGQWADYTYKGSFMVITSPIGE